MRIKNSVIRLDKLLLTEPLSPRGLNLMALRHHPHDSQQNPSKF